MAALDGASSMGGGSEGKTKRVWVHDRARPKTFLREIPHVNWEGVLSMLYVTHQLLILLTIAVMDNIRR